MFLLLLLMSSACLQTTTEFNVNQYITDCTSLEFQNLENLIGSIHIHEPKSILRVRDQGLTDGHRIILSRYQNTEIVSPKYSDNDEHFVHVTHELTRNERQSIVSTRRFPSNINNADSIRKKIALVVVIPFIREQTMALLEQLNASTIHKPCRNISFSKSFHDLILYHNEASDAPWIDDLHQKISQYDFLKDCFGHIRIFAANLSPEHNKYPLGSAYMWKRLFDEEGSVSLRMMGYTHFFLMEPDTRPLQSYWLDAIMEKIVDNRQEEFIVTDWWMFGSVYRGSADIGIHFLHINGNAIYHLSSSFLEFLQLVWRSYPFESGRTRGYDLDIFLFMLDPQNYYLSKHIWHKFRYSDFIQNCWHTGCSEVENESHTFLIHGKRDISINKRQIMDPSLSICLAFVIFMILVVSYIFRRRITCGRRLNFILSKLLPGR